MPPWNTEVKAGPPTLSPGRIATRSAATAVSASAIASISRATGTRDRSAMARLWIRSAGSRMK
jgi:hypothetical protein